MAGVVADRVIVELEAKIDRYNANVRAAEARFDAATRNITRSAQSMEKSMLRSTTAIGSQLRNMAAGIAAAFSVQQVAALADGYTRFTNQLKVAGVEGERLADTQETLFGIAQKYGVELESVGTLYSRITQAGKELGANSQEITQFTNGVAAALKIQGGAASESRGALLQLAQAMGSPIVRAEEFNSVNEGARPILQAVANGIDRFGGSVAKLRNEVIKGKVTSEEFFRGFLKGSADLEQRATKANLTIGASFTILNNALGKYIGETDQSLSATERISAAIIALSNNLDTVVKALALIATIMGGRFVAAMVAAAARTTIVSTALFAVQARAIGAATSMEALALAGGTAGRTLLAAFGGPVGLAVAALAAGFYYASGRVEELSQATGEYATMERQATDIRKKASDAADVLATATGRARSAALANAAAVREETVQYLAQARAALIAARAKAQAAQVEFNNAGLGSVVAGPVRAISAVTGVGPGANNARAQANLKAAEANVAAAEKAIKQLDAAIKAPPPVRTAAVEDGKKTKTKKPPKGPKGRDPDEIARQFQDDLDRGDVAYAQAMAEVIGTLEARRDAERLSIEVDRKINERAIKADKDYSDVQKARLIEENNTLAETRQAAIRAAEMRELQEENVELQQSQIDAERDRLETAGRLATTTAERRAIELRLLDLQKQEERLKLQSIRDNATLAQAERDRATAALASLDAKYGQKAEAVNAQYKTPGEAYLAGLNAEDINEQLESVAVDGLKGLEDQLTSTISKVFELGGAFGKIANQIIADLVRIAVRKAIIAPIAGALFGSGEGLGGLLGQILGGRSAAPRASGGHVNAGQIYRVNETGVEGFQPAGSGKIIPLGRMRQGGGGGGTTVLQTFTIDARYGITTPELLQHVNQLATARAAQAGRASYEASQRGVPQRIDRLQKLGS
jgi:tape measure domain-containing protein